MRRRAERLHGHLEVASSKDAGTTVRLVVPCDACDTRPGAPIRIVLIEDVRDVREALMALINGTQGFRCVSGFRTMEDALAGVAENQPTSS